MNTARLLGLAAGVLVAASAAGAAETASLEFEILDRIGWQGGKGGTTPAGPFEAPSTGGKVRVAARKVVETYSYDRKADVLTIDFRFDRKGFAPVPPMLALAVERGFGATFAPPARSTGHVSPLGPLMGVDGTDRYRCTIGGLGRYVAQPAGPGGGKAPEALVGELRDEVEKILSAKGHLAPWLVLVNVPGSGAPHRGDVYWSNPTETYYLLAEAAPLLDRKLAGRVGQYLRTLRRALPPEDLRAMPFTGGTAREHFPPSQALLAAWEAKVLAYRVAGMPPIWSLYGLARYHDLLGEKVTGQKMACYDAMVANGLKHRDWATLYWRRGRTPEFNAVHAVNRLFAGFVGYIRLARRAGDERAEALGWGLLGRTAALRYAMGKYTQFQHAHRLFNVRYAKNKGPALRVEGSRAIYSIPKDPAWWVKADGGEWIGNLRTWRWRRPIDNVRQVHRLDELGVDVWEWGAVDCGGTGQKRLRAKRDYWYERLCPYYLPFADMTPELARFLADHLQPECRAFVERVEENQPHWHVAYAEAVVGGEIGFMTPPNAHGLFLAKAWVLKEKPDVLARLIDVAWLPRGDLFYLHKLAGTIGAYRAGGREGRAQR